MDVSSHRPRVSIGLSCLQTNLIAKHKRIHSLMYTFLNCTHKYIYIYIHTTIININLIVPNTNGSVVDVVHILPYIK